MTGYKATMDEQQQILQMVNDYIPIDENGRLDIEYFCGALAMCFRYDGFDEKDIPNPGFIGRLLIDLLQRRLDKGDLNFQLNDWLQSQKLIDWNANDPECVYIYPTPEKHLIHVGGLVQVREKWIYLIGHELLNLPEPKKPGKYYAWAKREWVCTYAFLDSFHKKVWDFVKKIDLEDTKEQGYSLLEALHLSYLSDSRDYDHITAKLKQRAELYEEGISRIQKALDAKFFLEAVVLEESIISHYLFEYLAAKEVLKRPTSFHKLIHETRQHLSQINQSEPKLFRELDKWREHRNKAIHGFIQSGIKKEREPMNDFFLSTEAAAIQGKDHLEELIEWYFQQAVEFVQTDYPVDQSNLN